MEVQDARTVIVHGCGSPGDSSGLASQRSVSEGGCNSRRNSDLDAVRMAAQADAGVRDARAVAYSALRSSDGAVGSRCIASIC